MPVHDFDPPDRFVVGTVGPPGQRVFFLQAASGRRLVSVSCEKEQVAVLAERVDDVLDQFADDTSFEEVRAVDDNDPLATPIEDEFRVAAMSLAWDPARSALVIEAYDTDLSEQLEAQAEGSAAAGEPTPDGASAHTVVRVVLDAAQGRAFVRRARALISAGRPPCPFCGGPLGPTGHVCPRANGYRR